MIKQLLEMNERQRLLRLQQLFIDAFPDCWEFKLGGKDLLTVTCTRLPGEVVIKDLLHGRVNGKTHEEQLSDLTAYYQDADVRLLNMHINLTRDDKEAAATDGYLDDAAVTLKFTDVQDAFKALLLYSAGLMWKDIFDITEPAYASELQSFANLMTTLKPASEVNIKWQ